MEIQSQNISSAPPSYREILVEIGKQLDKRKGVFLRRILLLIWPVWIIVIIGFIWTAVFEVDQMFIEKFIEKSLPLNYYYSFLILLVFTLGWLVFTFFYFFTVGLLLEIEKRIWIDSYFDGKNLTPSASWRIAKKLLFPTLRFGIYTFMRFYALSAFIFLGTLIICSYLVDRKSISPESFIGWVFGVGLVILIYVWYVATFKLRFLWFVFLDFYGRKDFSYTLLIQEMDRLNQIQKTEMYKKILVADFATTSVEIIINWATQLLRSGLARFGKGGELAGRLTKVTGDMAVWQIATFGRIAARYILYRYARSVAFNAPQETNEYIYKL